MTNAPDGSPRDLGSADAQIEFVVAQLRASAATADPIAHLVHLTCAFDKIIRAATGPSASPELVAEASELLSEATARLTQSVAGEISSDRIAIGLGCAAALLTPEMDNLRDDRILHLAWATADLHALICRRELSRRGDPLSRMIAAKRAWFAAPNINIPLQ